MVTSKLAGWLEEYQKKGFWEPNQPSSIYCAIRISGRHINDVSYVSYVPCFILLS